MKLENQDNAVHTNFIPFLTFTFTSKETEREEKKDKRYVNKT